jgi:Zn-dependent oligopeptidase
MRDASKAFDKVTSDFNTDIWMREDLYQAMLNYEKEAKKDGSFEELDFESKRYVEKTLLDFTRNGMSLPEKSRNKLS